MKRADVRASQGEEHLVGVELGGGGSLVGAGEAQPVRHRQGPRRRAMGLVDLGQVDHLRRV